LVVVCVVAVVAGALELLAVPLRVGTAFAPVSVLFAVVGNVALPRAGRVFAARTAALVAPFLCWLVPFAGLALTPRPDGDVLVPGSGGSQWVFFAALAFGIVAGVITIVRYGPPRQPRRPVPGSRYGAVR